MTYLCVPLRGKRGGIAKVSESAWRMIDGVYWYLSKTGYAISPKVGFMHRRIMAAEPSEQIDHLNFDGLDNRHENLRCVPPHLNQVRTRKRKNSPWPYKGVRKLGHRWFARLAGTHIGCFDTAEDAARAYDTAARAKYGHNALCNFGELT